METEKIPSLVEMRYQTVMAFKKSDGMFRHLCRVKDLPGATIAYVACQQLCTLLQSMSSEPVRFEIRPKSEDAKAFLQSVFLKALEYSNTADDPAVVTLEKLGRHWMKFYENAESPVKLISKPRNLDVISSNLTGPRKVIHPVKPQAKRSLCLRRKAPRKRKVY